MLEKLEQINWSELIHAYGQASDIPDHIQKLRSDDSDVLRKTFSYLYNRLYHQSTIYEATVATIPFLIDLLTEDNIKSKASIISMLSHLSHGNYLRSYNLGLWDQLARTEVAKGFPVYLSLIDDEDWEIRIQAVAILSYSPRFGEDKAQVILDILANKLDSEENELVICALITGLGNMIGGYRLHDDNNAIQVASRIESIYKLESNPKIRLVVLLSIPKILQEETPQYVIDGLLNIVENPPFPGTPANMGDPSYFALKSLWHLDTKRCKESLEIAIQKPNASLDPLTIASAFMEWLYAEKGPNLPWRTLSVGSAGTTNYIYQKIQPQLKLDKLSDFQTQILRTIINEDTIWQFEHNLLERYGLPAEREEARKLLEK